MNKPVKLLKLDNERIAPSQCLYIKLGQSGEFEKFCFEEEQCIRLSYREVDHEACLRGRWDEVLKICRTFSKSESAAKNHLGQIKFFYEADPETLWYTFYKGRLYWCFAKPEIEKLADGTKIRRCIGSWSSKDLIGNELFINALSGKLTKTKGYRGTICAAKEPQRLTDRINGLVPSYVANAQSISSQFELALVQLIQNLTPEDFELLTETIFTNTGWIRIGKAGGQEKDIDLELVSPVTNEHVVVQIKSKARQSELEEYIQRLSGWGVTQFFFVYHTSDGHLVEPNGIDLKVKLIDSKRLAALVLNAGLANWLIEKSA